MVCRLIRPRSAFVLLALIVILCAAVRWSIYADVGPIAKSNVEIGNTLFPKQVTAHVFLSKWDAVHGRQFPQDDSNLRRVTAACVKEELSKKIWYGWLPEGERASLEEALVQLNMEGRPDIQLPTIQMPSFSGFFTSR